MTNRAGNERSFATRRFYDPQTNTFVDEEIPTVTIKLQGPVRRAQARMPSGTIEGSYRIAGTNYDLTPGTYSLRLTRISAGVAGNSGAGTSQNYLWRGTVYNFYVRHSRQGTLLSLPFYSPGRADLRGGPLNPVLSAGPGTLLWNWQTISAGGVGTRVTVTQELEGLLG